MRPGGQPRTANVSNGVALFDFGPLFGFARIAVKVPVRGNVIVGVADFHIVAKAAFAPHKGNNPVGYRLYRGAGGGGIVNAQVWPANTQNGVHPLGVKARGNAHAAEADGRF